MTPLGVPLAMALNRQCERRRWRHFDGFWKAIQLTKEVTWMPMNRRTVRIDCQAI
jgi:hypothetical protein